MDKNISEENSFIKKYFSSEKWKYLWYTLSHPMDGFYWIRRKDKGSVPIAILLVICFSFCFSLNRYLASFVGRMYSLQGFSENASTVK